jgi:AraC family transcriptional regulator
MSYPIENSGHLYGELLKSHHVAGLSLAETAYSSDLRLPRHSHGHAYISLVLQGSYTETYGKRTRICKPSAVIFHPPDEVHSDLFHAAGGRCFDIHVGPDWLNHVREYAAILDSPADFYGGSLYWLTTRLYHEFREPDEIAPLAIEGLTLEVIAEAGRSGKTGNRKSPRWIEKTRERLHAQFSERLTLTEVAASVGVHPVHLAREFRKHYSCTIGDYVRRLRIEFACHEIATTEAPLVEIALAAGFSHQSHFSRTFKRLRGMTPAEFRAVCRLR